MNEDLQPPSTPHQQQVGDGQPGQRAPQNVRRYRASRPERPHDGQTPLAFIAWLLSVVSPFIWLQMVHALPLAAVLGGVCVFAASAWMAFARSDPSLIVSFGCGGILIGGVILFAGCAIAIGSAY